MEQKLVNHSVCVCVVSVSIELTCFHREICFIGHTTRTNAPWTLSCAGTIAVEGFFVTSTWGKNPDWYLGDACVECTKLVFKLCFSCCVNTRWNYYMVIESYTYFCWRFRSNWSTKSVTFAQDKFRGTRFVMRAACIASLLSVGALSKPEVRVARRLKQNCRILQRLIPEQKSKEVHLEINWFAFAVCLLFVVVSIFWHGKDSTIWWATLCMIRSFIYVSFCVGLGFVEARTSFPTFEFCYSQSRLDSWYIDLWACLCRALQFSWKWRMAFWKMNWVSEMNICWVPLNGEKVIY